MGRSRREEAPSHALDRVMAPHRLDFGSHTLQTTMAGKIGVSKILLGGANCSGGALAKMISPQN